jgi:hypothetical protein
MLYSEKKGIEPPRNLFQMHSKHPALPIATFPNKIIIYININKIEKNILI